MNRTSIATAVILATSMTASVTATAKARDQIRVVGSATVFQFATAVAKRFGKLPGNKSPSVFASSTGSGLRIFCAGIGLRHPDIVMATRRIKKSEVARCAKNGVTDIVEVKIGYDGIVIGNTRSAKRYELTVRDLYLALAKQVPAGEAGRLIDNPNKTWQDVNSALPPVKIKVLGPRVPSATLELALEEGCKTFKWINALKTRDEKTYKKICHTMRGYPAYSSGGLGMNVRWLEGNVDALAIFGFNVLDRNTDRIQGSMVNGVNPEFETIASGKYPFTRGLFLYVKDAHFDWVPGLRGYLQEFTSETAWGDDGYLVDIGLIPMPAADRAEAARLVRPIGHVPSCSPKAISGTYNTSVGAMQCKSNGPGLSCCYASFSGDCYKKIELKISSDKPLLTGKWIHTNRGTVRGEGPVEFRLTKDCSLSHGRWGVSKPDKPWPVTGRR